MLDRKTRIEVSENIVALKDKTNGKIYGVSYTEDGLKYIERYHSRRLYYYVKARLRFNPETSKMDIVGNTRKNPDMEVIPFYPPEGIDRKIAPFIRKALNMLSYRKQFNLLERYAYENKQRNSY